jgi:hypothetical protein
MNVFGLLALYVSLPVIALLLMPVVLRVNRLKYIAQALSFPLVLLGLGLLAAVIAIVICGLTGLAIWSWVLGVWLAYAFIAWIKILQLGFINKKLRDDESRAETDELVVLGWNTLGDSIPVEYMRDVILKFQPDAVGLPEMTGDHRADLVTSLSAAGYEMRGYTVGPQDGHLPHETSLLIKASYGEYSIRRLNVLGASTLEANPLEAGNPAFVAVHTVAPMLDKHQFWIKDLQMLSDHYKGTTKTILVGDFNATALHMMGLGGEPGDVLGGFTDAASTVHAAALGTWPIGKSMAIGTQIDHVLYTSEYTATEFQVLNEYDDSGSDHRAIVAKLKLK